jgi:predicted acylesterase/phospholipase RssA
MAVAVAVKAAPTSTDWVQEARAALLAGAAVPDLRAAVEGLERAQAFRYARLLLERALNTSPLPDQEVWLREKLALSTYKDSQLPAAAKLERALEHLRPLLEAPEPSPETLGLAGAIHKRRWALDGQRVHLERSLAAYSRGYAIASRRREAAGAAAATALLDDLAFTGINAAFVLDALARDDEREAAASATPDDAAALHRRRAADIRRELVRELEPAGAGARGDAWWYAMTLVEAYMGLERFDDAARWVARAMKRPPDGWKWESSATQIATLAAVRNLIPLEGSAEALEAAPAWRVIQELVGDNPFAARRAIAGKLGLGLSGGGFRASLFHIGVLARLAELDLLRHVEVLSCVSGGSIVGVQLYLELQQMLESKAEPTQEDYLDAVGRLAAGFAEGVKKNVRTRVLADWVANLHMLLAARSGLSYTRTLRIGKLFERELFARVPVVAGRLHPSAMSDLSVNPAGAVEFKIRDHNWQRAAKVPALVLNATTLNTGHGWQFAATFMGEPPAGTDPAVEGNARLRRFHYVGDNAPPEWKRVPIGQAVAASACVPGLFTPVVLDGLYAPARRPGGAGADGALRVGLVDGGTHDNQGIATLLEQECNVLFVSDASGQMETQERAKVGILGVLGRSSSILQSRVRAAQLDGAVGLERAGYVRGLRMVHLREGLSEPAVAWRGCEEPEDSYPWSREPAGDLGIAREVQEALAHVRTDLDSFHDVEAAALMTCGYRMAVRALDAEPRQRDRPDPFATLRGAEVRRPWAFLEVAPAMGAGDGPAHAELLRLLRASKSIAFKVWTLVPALRAAAVAIAVVLALALTAAALWRPNLPLITLGGAFWTLAGALAALVVGRRLVRSLRWSELARAILVGVAAATVGWLAARIHLLWFDRWYLRLGSMERFRRLMKSPADPPRQT